MNKNIAPNTITARSSHTPVTPRKANLVLESIIGLKPQEAIDQLQLVTKRAAQPVIKLLKQALGNAADQQKTSPDELIIDQAFATKGKALKFIRFAGRGRVKPYQKIASHLTIILKIKDPSPNATSSPDNNPSKKKPVKVDKNKK